MQDTSVYLTPMQRKVREFFSGTPAAAPSTPMQQLAQAYVANDPRLAAYRGEIQSRIAPTTVFTDPAVIAGGLNNIRQIREKLRGTPADTVRPPLAPTERKNRAKQVNTHRVVSSAPAHAQTTPAVQPVQGAQTAPQPTIGAAPTAYMTAPTYDTNARSGLAPTYAINPMSGGMSAAAQEYGREYGTALQHGLVPVVSQGAAAADARLLAQQAAQRHLVNKLTDANNMHTAMSNPEVLQRASAAVAYGADPTTAINNSVVAQSLINGNYHNALNAYRAGIPAATAAADRMTNFGLSTGTNVAPVTDAFGNPYSAGSVNGVQHTDGGATFNAGGQQVFLPAAAVPAALPFTGGSFGTNMFNAQMAAGNAATQYNAQAAANAAQAAGNVYKSAAEQIKAINQGEQSAAQAMYNQARLRQQVEALAAKQNNNYGIPTSTLNLLMRRATEQGITLQEAAEQLGVELGRE